ncbi:MAG: hypothetical protein ACI4M5_02025 [Christensenellales bacterium]
MNCNKLHELPNGMNCTQGALWSNSIHGAEREIMAKPIHDVKDVNSFI